MKREVAGRAGFRSPVRDTPNRDANGWQWRTGLVVDRPGKRSRWLCGSGCRRRQQRQDRGNHDSHTSDPRSYHVTSRGNDRWGQDTRLMPRVSVRFQGAVLAGWLVLGAVSSAAQVPVKQVLVLQSFNRGNVVVDSFTGHFRVELDKRAGAPMNVVEVVVGPTGFVGAPEREAIDYIRSIFADRPKPDLVMAVAGPATVFARRYRQQLFPDTPLLFAAVDQRFLRDAPLGENEAAVTVINNPSLLIEEILQLLPETRQVFVVTGSGLLSKFWRRELDEEFRRFHDRLTFVWSEELSLPEILRRCASLPRHSAIFYLTFGTDAQGGAYADERVLDDIHATANAPLFGVQSWYIGSGVVGGTLMSIDTLARNTADVTIRLLNGAPPESINVPPQRPGQPLFDWRELQRWGIAESRLPAGSVVSYRSPSLWSEYKFTVLGAMGALVIQALLIIGLLYQRRARQRAELDSRRNLALAADVSRRQTMSVLTSSIAHELGQPLSSMIHNAEALEMMITADRATPGTIAEIVSDIRSQGVQATHIIDRHRDHAPKSQVGQETDRPSRRDI